MTSSQALLLLLWLGSVTIFFAEIILFLTVMGTESRPRTRQAWLAAPLTFAPVALLWTPWAAWALVACSCAVVVHGAWHAVWVLRRRRQLMPASPGLTDRVTAAARTLGARPPQAVRVEHQGLIGPAVVGLWRQTLVLTPAVLDLPEGEFRAILAHELAHVQHRDGLKLWLAGLARLLLGWHPLARRTVAWLSLEIELEADRQAAAWSGDARAYALALGRWGLRQVGPEGGPAPASLNRGPASDLLIRLQVLTDPASPAPHLKLPFLPQSARSRTAGRSRRLMPFLLPFLYVGYLGAFILVSRFV